MSKLLKKIYWWAWYKVYSRRVTWGVQWYRKESSFFRDQCIKDIVFFRREKAEKYWEKVKASVNKDHEAATREIERGNYKKVLKSVNY